MLHFRICESNPNQEKGGDAAKVLAQSRIVALEGRQFSWQSGREIVIPDGSVVGEYVHTARIKHISDDNKLVDFLMCRRYTALLSLIASALRRAV